MSLAFSHSLVSLRADGSRRTLLGLLGAALLLGGWLAWFFLARLTVCELSRSARLEVQSAAHVVGSPVGGRVIATHLVLGRQVRVGDVLVEFDTEALRLERQEAQARLAGLSAQLGPAREQLAAQTRALDAHARIAGARIAEARARREQAWSTAGLASREARQAGRLLARGVLSRMEAEREDSQSQQNHSGAQAAGQALARTVAEQRAEEESLRAGLAQLAREVARLEGEFASESAALAVLTQRLEARTLRAPIAGRVGEVAPLQAGAVVAEGSALCTLVPEGELKVVAAFLPGEALGRVRPGQPARVRLDGFPWPRHGSLPARVSRVASEVREGMVRVELRLEPRPGPPLPLQHGLPGQVEVELERVSPAVLVLRAAGRRLEGGTG